MNYEIRVETNRSRVLQVIPRDILRRIHKLTSYKIEDAVTGEPRTVFLFDRRQSFPTGLLHRVNTVLKKTGHTVSVIDQREKYKLDTQKALQAIKSMPVTLRDYQAESVARGLQYPYGLFWHPTASGKTLQLSTLMKAYDLTTLVLTHRKELMYQLADEISKFTDREVGMIGDGNWTLKKFTVGIVNSFNDFGDDRKKRIVEKYLSKVRYLIIDECHHQASDTWVNVSKSCVNTVARHGFSGTVFRADGKDILILAHTGDVISKYTTQYMIDNGWLSKPIIYMPDVYMTRAVAQTSNWNKVESEYIMKNQDRNRIGCRFISERYEKGHQILVLVRLVKHGNIVKDMLVNEFGVENRDVRYMWGGADTFQRKAALRDFRAGKFQILIGSSIYNEGVDLPKIQSAVNFAGGNSDIATIQRLGRAIRKTRPEGAADVDTSEEQTIDYMDFYDQGHNFVLRHSQGRLRLYKDEGHTIDRMRDA